jgi:hypothetical protein
MPASSEETTMVYDLLEPAGFAEVRGSGSMMTPRGI